LCVISEGCLCWRCTYSCFLSPISSRSKQLILW
jgi:hypothetical protein